jgi:hypothetical protein
MAKMTPAIGALKVAEIPPAAPQATRSLRISDYRERRDRRIVNARIGPS